MHRLRLMGRSGASPAEHLGRSKTHMTEFVLIGAPSGLAVFGACS